METDAKHAFAEWWKDNADKYRYSGAEHIWSVWRAAWHARGSNSPEVIATCPENMLPCTDGCTGGWCRTLFGHPSDYPQTEPQEGCAK